MTETKTLNGLLKVKRNYGPSFANVLFSWFFYGMFRMAFYRFLILPWSVFGIALNFILLFSAISITLKAMFTPRYHYTFQTEVEDEESSTIHEHPHETTFSSEASKKEMKPESNEINTPPIKTKEPKPESNPEVDKQLYCSYCGVEVPEYARFCSSCGERLR